MDNSLVSYTVFESHKNILAFSTTKKLVKHTAPRFTGDSPELFAENRKQLADVLKISPAQLVFPRQTHTNCVAELSEIPETEINETDALVTNQPGICLCVQTADCVPILLFDPEEKVVAAIHAGWRGTVKKIAETTVLKMKKNYGTSPENLLALVGPSIGPGIYEVGDEVVTAAHQNIPHAAKSLHKNSKGRFHFNLWEANRQILLQCGLNSKNIEIAGECSFTQAEKYFSARRDGVDTGRTVSGIMLLE